MTEFIETALRQRCRNRRCRSKLPVPVGNEREAFCCRSCYQSFYLRRCRVCETPIEQNAGQRRVICKKSRCRNAWRANEGFGRYRASSDASMAPKSADFIGVKTPHKPDRAWRVIAGQELTASQLHCATVPDGPNCQWEGGDYQRIEAKNRAALKAAEQAEIEANGEFTEPEWCEVISPDGVRCFVTRFRDAGAKHSLETHQRPRQGD